MPRIFASQHPVKAPGTPRKPDKRPPRGVQIQKSNPPRRRLVIAVFANRRPGPFNPIPANSAEKEKAATGSIFVFYRVKFDSLLGLKKRLTRVEMRCPAEVTFQREKEISTRTARRNTGGPKRENCLLGSKVKLSPC